MFYYSNIARSHHFDRYEAEQDWKVAGILEKAHQAMLGKKNSERKNIPLERGNSENILK